MPNDIKILDDKEVYELIYSKLTEKHNSTKFLKKMEQDGITEPYFYDLKAFLKTGKLRKERNSVFSPKAIRKILSNLDVKFIAVMYCIEL